jgi:hypothetical protein
MTHNGEGIAASTGSQSYDSLTYFVLLISDLWLKDSTSPV